MENENITIKLLLTRHGQTEENKTQTICGQMPGNLTHNGIQQAQMIGAWFQKEKKIFHHAYVSDLKRTRDTFQNIKKQAKYLSEIPTHYTPLLREKSGGVLEGKPLKTWKEQADKQKKTIRQYKCKNSESWQDVNTRAGKFIQFLVQEHIISNNPINLKQKKQGKQEKKQGKKEEKKQEQQSQTKGEKQSLTKMMEKLSLQQKSIDILAVSHGGFIMEFHNVIRVLFQKEKAVFDNTAHNCSFHEFLIEYPTDMVKYDPKYLRMKCIIKNFTQHLK